MDDKTLELFAQMEIDDLMVIFAALAAFDCTSLQNSKAFGAKTLRNARNLKMRLSQVCPKFKELR